MPKFDEAYSERQAEDYSTDFWYAGRQYQNKAAASG